MTEQPAEITRHLHITGRVQGVNYRAWMCRTAENLGVRGWVRNRHDGAVEAVAAGPAEAVGALIEACRDGPDPARVANIEVAPSHTPPPQRDHFEAAPTV